MNSTTDSNTFCVVRNPLKMVKLFLSLVSIVLVLKVGAQRSLTKDEILKRWKTKKKTYGGNPAIWVSYDNSADLYAHFFVDSLHKAGIDTVIIYSVSVPGSFATSDCYQAIPVRTHIFWKSKERTFVKAIIGKCRYETSSVDALDLFSFYRDNQKEIDTAVIMPAILGAQLDRDKKFSYTMSMVSHQAEYRLYYSIAGFRRSILFVENDIDDKNSLFYTDNQSLKLYSWWQKAEQLTKAVGKD